MAYYSQKVDIAIMIGITFSLLNSFFCFLLNKPLPSFLLIMPVVAAIVVILLYALSLNDIYIRYGTLFFEIIFVLLLWLFTIFKPKIKKTFHKREKVKDLEKSIYFNEFFRTLSIFRNILTFHLVLVGIYQFCLSETLRTYDQFMFSQLSAFLILVISVYEYVRLSMLRAEIKTEDWLSVVNESGSVIGKIALSVSRLSERRFMHPVVRIALIHNDMVYLTQRASDVVAEPDKMDYPFEGYVLYKQTLNDTLGSLIGKCADPNTLSIKYLFKYVFKSQVTHRLIYLYTITLSDKQASCVHFPNGKWWHQKQIEENLGRGLFSDFFEKEYELLKLARLSKQSGKQSLEEKDV